MAEIEEKKIWWQLAMNSKGPLATPDKGSKLDLTEKSEHKGNNNFRVHIIKLRLP